MRDTIARQFDVDSGSVKYDIEPGTKSYRLGTITFSAKKGKSIDLEKLQDSLKATRLGKRTNSGVNTFDVTAEGDVVVVGKEARLEVSGTKQRFILRDDPKAKPKEGTKTAYQRLREAQAKGEKIVSVSGRVQAWNGKWPAVLKALSEEADRAKEKGDKTAKPALVLVVSDFRTVKK